ncbi:MAG: pseudouridine synthase [Burkholderiales bacterium]|jgi:23S rRNA pseudouridine2457 synthase|nr:pseudouridine synthase [Burkholderiales bacterium]
MPAQVILLNKPYGVICQFTPSGNHPTLKDFVPIADVYPAGRLDTDSEGLVVLTGDGDLQHRITDPRHKLPKTYFVEVEGAPGDAALAPIRKGIQLSDYRARPAEVTLVAPPDWLWPRVPPVRFRQKIPTTWLKITIREGRNRQVRHMTAAAGFPTLRLIRHSVGPWTLAGIAPGAWKSADSKLFN